MASGVITPVSSGRSREWNPGYTEIFRDAGRGACPCLEAHVAGGLDEDGAWDGEEGEFPRIQLSFLIL